MKPFRTLDEQVSLLKQRGMNIPRKQDGVRILSKDNYYRLINGYKDLLLDQETPADQYTNRSLKDFCALSDFDKTLKMSYLSRLVQIETQLKGVISYEFSRLHGGMGYLDSNNFEKLPGKSWSMRKKRAEFISNWISSVHATIASQYQYKKYISHYFDTHQEIPLWVLVNAVSFGDLVKLYTICKAETKDAIAARFEIPTATFQLFIEHLRIVRNVCAHDERFFSFNTVDKNIPKLYIHEDLHLSSNAYSARNSYNDIFATYISILHFLTKKEAEHFTKEIKRCIRKLESSSTVDIRLVMGKMGYPSNWEDAVFLINKAKLITE